MRKTWNPAKVTDQGETPPSYLTELVPNYEEIESILDQILPLTA